MKTWISQQGEINTPTSKKVSYVTYTEKGGFMNEISIKCVVSCPNMAGMMHVRIIHGNVMQWSEKTVAWFSLKCFVKTRDKSRHLFSLMFLS